MSRPKIVIAEDRKRAGQAAAALGAENVRSAIRNRGEANVILATGASQFDVIEALLNEVSIAWERVTIFHLDEFVGLHISHPASFRAYLWKRFHQRLSFPPKAFHYICGEPDPTAECRRLGALIGQHPIDVCFAGIGENAHLAFNDPPADFDTVEPYLIVNLDDSCRRQQLGEGWFPNIDAVPRQAISMSIRQILSSKVVVITAPDQRKAQAVRDSLLGNVSNRVPSSALQNHPNVHVFLDPPAASLLPPLLPQTI